MIQTAQFHSPHPHSFQGHMQMNPYMRMNEQRWQDVAGLLDNTTNPGHIPTGHSSHHPFSHHAVAALHNLSHPHPHHPHHPHMSTYPSHPTPHNPMHLHQMDHHSSGFANPNSTPNISSAVASSINLTGTADSLDSGAAASYKMENHDIMYFPNTSSEISNATDGFLSSILNDEDLQLMDMAMGDGMYPSMRMMDGNQTQHRVDHVASAASERMDASSDSAVSSMGSERVASLSDNEWGDATSDSGHNADHYVLDYASKYRPYNYSYRQQTPSGPSSNTPLIPGDQRRPSVAQKKHHMFGKRFFQDQTGIPSNQIKYDPYNSITSPPSLMDIRNPQSVRPKDIKFPCALDHPGHIHTGRTPLDHVHHNHTYNLPPESTGTMQRPIFRDKGKSKLIIFYSGIFQDFYFSCNPVFNAISRSVLLRPVP